MYIYICIYTHIYMFIGAEAVSVVKEREGLGESLALLSLIVSFFFIMYWRRARQVR
jgi:hypothetical protein